MDSKVQDITDYHIFSPSQGDFCLNIVIITLTQDKKYIQLLFIF